MAQSRQKLLFHPVRYRILRALNGTQLTTQAITDALGDVPQSTVYRHLKLLLDADVIEISDTREINGIIEKIYAHHPHLHLTANEFAQLSKDEHIANIEHFALSLMQSVGKAITNSPEPFDAMPLTYREYAFYATEEEFLALRKAIFKLLRDAEKKYSEQGEGQKHYKVNITTHEDI
ncbi:MAG: helix-turn-helix domain-containing protein [Chloroflexota bacterium]